ncbi:MAG TPA: HIT family protein [Candidatus Paceibacterota bacterium]
MENCIFCKIVAGTASSDKVYEDDKFLAFLSIEPIHEGHLLVIPKDHIIWMQDAGDEIVAPIFIITRNLMRALKKVSRADYIQVSVSGEEIAHFHIHLFSRYYNDGLLRFPHTKYKGNESNEIAKKITQAL